jgi:hypothetical protein
VATPEQHKSRLRREALTKIVSLLKEFDIKTEELEGFKCVTQAESLAEHRKRSALKVKHAENLAKAHEAARQKRQEKQGGTK